MFLRFIAFFLGLVLATIHVVVGLITYFVYDDLMGALFLIGSAGYSAGAFLIIFNLQKGGLVLIALFHFLDFGMMLYYGEIMLLFPCLLAEASAFLIILDIWKGYATGSEEAPPEVDMVTKRKADSLGFDSNYYFDKYYDKLEGKGGKPKKEGLDGKPLSPVARPRPESASKRPMSKPRVKSQKKKEPAPKVRD